MEGKCSKWKCFVDYLELNEVFLGDIFHFNTLNLDLRWSSGLNRFKIIGKIGIFPKALNLQSRKQIDKLHQKIPSSVITETKWKMQAYVRAEEDRKSSGSLLQNITMDHSIVIFFFFGVSKSLVHEKQNPQNLKSLFW